MGKAHPTAPLPTVNNRKNKITKQLSSSNSQSVPISTIHSQKNIRSKHSISKHNRKVAISNINSLQNEQKQQEKTNNSPAGVGPKIIIKVGILGKKMRCLVDTGAMLNCIGFNDVPKEVMDNLGPSLVSINAYGNKGLRCLGTFRTDVKAVTKNGETVFPGVMFYVLNEACAPVLGTPFVCEEIFTADVKKKEISIGDKIIRCESEWSTGLLNAIVPKLMKVNDPCQRVELVAHKGVTVPPNCEQILPLKADTVDGRGLYLADDLSTNIDGIVMVNALYDIFGRNTVCARV